MATGGCRFTMGGVSGYMATGVLAAGDGSTTPPPTGGFAIGDWVVVSADTVNFRSQPSTSATVVMVLSRGRRLVITGGPVSANGYVWYQAQTTPQTGRVTGRVIGLALVPQHPETPGDGLLRDVGSVAYVNTDTLNLRAEPTLSAPVVAVLPRDSALTVTGSPVGADGYEWYPGATATGVSGWAAARYMREEHEGWLVPATHIGRARVARPWSPGSGTHPRRGRSTASHNESAGHPGRWPSTPPDRSLAGRSCRRASVMRCPGTQGRSSILAPCLAIRRVLPGGSARMGRLSGGPPAGTGWWVPSSGRTTR